MSCWVELKGKGNKIGDAINSKTEYSSFDAFILLLMRDAQDCVKILFYESQWINTNNTRETAESLIRIIQFLSICLRHIEEDWMSSILLKYVLGNILNSLSKWIGEIIKRIER